MGFASSVEEVKVLVESVDTDGSGEIGFGEFLDILEGKSVSRNRRMKNRSALASKNNSAVKELSHSGSQIKKMQSQLESGKLGDNANLSLETLLVAFQRRIITNALFARGFRAAEMKLSSSEKERQQGIVDTLYDSFIADREAAEAARLKAERKLARKVAREKRRVRKRSISGSSSITSTESDPASSIADAGKLFQTAASEIHDNKRVNISMPRGRRLNPSTTVKAVLSSTVKAGRHTHHRCDVRDRRRDKFMRLLTSADRQNGSLNAPLTRTLMGVKQSEVFPTNASATQHMLEKNKVDRRNLRKTIPKGRNPALHKLLIGRPLATKSRVPSFQHIEAVPRAITSSFLLAKKEKVLGLTKLPRSMDFQRRFNFRRRGVRVEY